MSITDSNFNQARQILINGDSQSALLISEKRSRGGSLPVHYGYELIETVVDEFRDLDANDDNYTKGMTFDHYLTVTKAAMQMNLDIEEVLNGMFLKTTKVTF